MTTSVNPHNALPSKMRNDKCAPIGSMINDEYGSRAHSTYTALANTKSGHEPLTGSQEVRGLNPCGITSTLSSGGKTLSPRVEALRKRIMGG